MRDFDFVVVIHVFGVIRSRVCGRVRGGGECNGPGSSFVLEGFVGEGYFEFDGFRDRCVAGSGNRGRENDLTMLRMISTFGEGVRSFDLFRRGLRSSGPKYVAKFPH